MCIIIDTNVFGDLTNNTIFSNEYKPVVDWVVRGNGKFVFGGSKYFHELRKNRKVLNILIQLEKVNKVVIVCNEEVDEYQENLQRTSNHPDFDDPHLVAIVAVSNCRLICTRDLRAIPFITDRKYFPEGIKPPKIYSGKRNVKLLCDRNIAEVCKPCGKLNRSERDQFQRELYPENN